MIALLFLALHVNAAPLDLNGALKLTLEKSPKYQSLRLAEKNAELAEKNAWSLLFPTADVQATHTYSRLESATSSLPGTEAASPWSNRLGVSIAENLYDNGDTWRKAKSSGLQRRIEALSLEDARGKLIVAVAKAYYDYSAAIAALELQQRQLDSLKRQFRSIEGRYQRGMSSNRDYLRITAQVRSAEINLLTAQLRIEDALGALRATVGDSAAEFAPMKPDAPSADDVAAPILSADATYEIRMNELRDRVAELAYESVHRTEWPRVSLQASYSYEQPNYLGPRRDGLDDPYWNLQATLTLDYRLWDWGRTWREVEIAANTLSIDRATRAQSRLQIEQDLRQLANQARLLASSVRMSREINKASEAAFSSVNQAYLEGKTTYLEFITALNDVSNSRLQEINLRFSILKLKAELAHAQGKIDELFQIR